jgi:hypothetical protein
VLTGNPNHVTVYFDFEIKIERKSNDNGTVQASRHTTDTSYTFYSVFNANLHLQFKINLFCFTTCFGHKGPTSVVSFAKTVAL